MITCLKNPLTQNYLKFKNLVTSSDFPLYANTLGAGPESLGIEDTYYSHTFIQRPEDVGYTMPISGQTCLAMSILDEILSCNNISYHMVYRLNLNINHHHSNYWYAWHKDHQFPHSNIMIYLNSFDEGKIELQSESGKIYSHQPKEDGVILFGGEKHRWGPTPVGQKRVSIVTTILLNS